MRKDSKDSSHSSSADNESSGADGGEILPGRRKTSKGSFSVRFTPSHLKSTRSSVIHETSSGRRAWSSRASSVCSATSSAASVSSTRKSGSAQSRRQWQKEKSKLLRVVKKLQEDRQALQEALHSRGKNSEAVGENASRIRSEMGALKEMREQLIRENLLLEEELRARELENSKTARSAQEEIVRLHGRVHELDSKLRSREFQAAPSSAAEQSPRCLGKLPSSEVQKESNALTMAHEELERSWRRLSLLTRDLEGQKDKCRTLETREAELVETIAALSQNDEQKERELGDVRRQMAEVVQDLQNHYEASKKEIHMLKSRVRSKENKVQMERMCSLRDELDIALQVRPTPSAVTVIPEGPEESAMSRCEGSSGEGAEKDTQRDSNAHVIGDEGAGQVPSKTVVPPLVLPVRGKPKVTRKSTSTCTSSASSGKGRDFPMSCAYRTNTRPVRCCCVDYGATFPEKGVFGDVNTPFGRSNSGDASVTGATPISTRMKLYVKRAVRAVFPGSLLTSGDPNTRLRGLVHQQRLYDIENSPPRKTYSRRNKTCREREIIACSDIPETFSEPLPPVRSPVESDSSGPATLREFLDMTHDPVLTERTATDSIPSTVASENLRIKQPVDDKKKVAEEMRYDAAPIPQEGRCEGPGNPLLVDAL